MFCLVITNNPDNILNLHVVNPLDMQFSSDHLLVLFDFIWKPKRPPKQSRFVYSYKKADFDALRDTLDATPFPCALDNENVDGDWQCWHGLFIACVEQHVPKIKIRDINSPPWIDSEVIHLLHKMDSARKKALSRDRGGDARASQNPAWEKYRKLRRESKALIDRKHKEYLDSIASSVSVIQNVSGCTSKQELNLAQFQTPFHITVTNSHHLKQLQKLSMTSFIPHLQTRQLLIQTTKYITVQRPLN